MEPRRDPPPWLPAVAAPAQPAVPEPTRAAGGPAPKPRPTFTWQRLTRSRRGAAGLAIGTAAVLLWPFSGWSLIPWLVGIGVLVLLRLLRLDGLLRGWVFHLGGVVVVVGLMYSTDPWAWALAASIGVLLAGLLQLPWWRLAAVGAVMCVVSGVGFGISNYHTAQVQRQIESHAGDQLRSQLGESRPGRILPALLQAVAENDPDPVCRLVLPAAETALLAAVGTTDCPAAVGVLHGRAPAGADGDRTSLPQPKAVAGGWEVDACQTGWAAAAGRGVGVIAIGQTDPAVQRYNVIGFRPC
jgi:hypothetical protein